MAKKNVAAAVVTPVVEPEDALVVKMSELLASNKVASLQSEVDSLQAKLEAARSKLEEEQSESLQRIDEMAKTVKRLRGARLNEAAIEAAVRAQFGVSRRPAKRAEGESTRKSHKLDDSGATRVLNAIKAHKDGALMSELWEDLPDMDRIGVQNLVRKMAADNKIKAQGQTRSRRYVVA